jgi:hypothetical protein
MPKKPKDAKRSTDAKARRTKAKHQKNGTTLPHHE